MYHRVYLPCVKTVSLLLATIAVSYVPFTLLSYQVAVAESVGDGLARSLIMLDACLN